MMIGSISSWEIIYSVLSGVNDEENKALGKKKLQIIDIFAEFKWYWNDVTWKVIRFHFMQIFSLKNP